MSIGQKVAQARMLLGLTQAELAKNIGVSQNTIFKIEKGITLESGHFPKIAKALQMTTEQLLSEDYEMPKPEISPAKAKSIRKLMEADDSLLSDIEQAIDAALVVGNLKKKARDLQAE